ncbi:MAG: diaminopimelate decarboxylase [Bacteroidales bacterium]|nr:diaminopimelate decarboxylase [Bacteroidales bacterium]
MVTFKDIKKIGRIRTPFYYYDMELLESTLKLFRELLDEYGYTGHFALKSNDRKRILETVRKYGLGADCVSGDEVSLALNCGFPSDSIVFAGVGKSDREIVTALKSGIFCFNCESIPELEVIDSLASKLRVTANVALRINPEVDAHTLSNISTGRKEDKFGISLASIDKAIDKVKYAKNLKLIGLHFHIGSQIEDMEVFATLCRRINEIQVRLSGRGITVSDINVGGGLGVDYRNPDSNPIPPFREYFETIRRNLILQPGQKVHLEPGRSIVAQCGSLISRVLYVKEGENRNFLVLDAGMNDLIRPALYGSYHKIENLTSKGKNERYDVVGPVCESSDCWGKGRILPHSSRGDLMAIRSAGAYGQVMAMRYNARPLAKEYYSDNF